MTQQIYLPVGLADAELEGYRRIGAELVVEIRAWNEKHVKVLFHDVIALRDSLAGSFSDLVQEFPASEDTLKEALARNFESVPVSHPYRVYSFLNLEGDPSLEVVATSCEIKIR